VTASFILAYYIRNLFSSLHPINNYLWLLFVIIPLWGILLHYNNLYYSQRGKALRSVWVKIIKADAEGLLVLGAFFFVFKIHNLNRTLILLFILITTLLLILERFIVLKSLQYLRKKGKNVRNLLIVGTGERAKRFIKNINKHSETGFRIVGCLDIDPNKVGGSIEGAKIIGLSDQLSEILHSEVVDDVIYALPWSKDYLRQIKSYLSICQQLGINGRIIADFYNWHDIFSGKIFIDELLDVPLISFSTNTGQLLHLYFKRFIDLVVSLAAIIILSPVMLIVAVIIKLTSSGSIIFRQNRSGLNGRKFHLYKFRTMVENAESQQGALRELNKMSGPVFKMDDDPRDPRVTWVGKFLRKTSLDELPQLFNVLDGSMSLVGPRPLPVYEAAHIKHDDRRRLSMKPGITCLWQINGRNDIDFDQWMKLDLQYVDNWSLRLDFKILLKTIPVVLIGKGAG